MRAGFTYRCSGTKFLSSPHLWWVDALSMEGVLQSNTGVSSFSFAGTKYLNLAKPMSFLTMVAGLWQAVHRSSLQTLAGQAAETKQFSVYKEAKLGTSVSPVLYPVFTDSLLRRWGRPCRRRLSVGL